MTSDEQIPVVTIDGPSGAGKGTLCRLVAQKTGYNLLDSGALYRLTALSGIQQGVDIQNEMQAEQLAKALDITFLAGDEKTITMLAGKDVSADIRREDVGMGASVVAALPAVRSALLQRQRDFCAQPGLVADGRDMGTVVFPGAQVKIFLTASSEERARRRVKQIEEMGGEADYPKILSDIEARDEKDSSRATAPLVAAPDALELDSTRMTINEVFAAVMAQIEKRYSHV